LRPPAASARGAISRSAAFGLAALLLVSALGYWGVATYRKAQLHKAVTVLVRDSSERLTAALVLEIEAVTRLDEHAQEVDRHVIELRDMSASPDRALAAAAEEYLLTVRQILREQAASNRYRLQVAAADERLREHMRTAAEDRPAGSPRRCEPRTAWRRATSTTASLGGARAGCSRPIPRREREMSAQLAGVPCSPTSRGGRAQADAGKLEACRRERGAGENSRLGVEEARRGTG
jgi:hypothetical protein